MWRIVKPEGGLSNTEEASPTAAGTAYAVILVTLLLGTDEVVPLRLVGRNSMSAKRAMARRLCVTSRYFGSSIYIFMTRAASRFAKLFYSPRTVVEVSP